MPYAEDGRQLPAAQDKQASLGRELASYRVARSWLAAHASVDESRVFMAGVSKGGWTASSLGEMDLARLGGLIILLAGRPYASTRTLPVAALHNKPIYIGTGPRGVPLKCTGAAGRL